MNATQIAQSIEDSSEYRAEVWTRGERERVYVTRPLSRDRKEMGYIEIEGGAIDYMGLIRNKAGIRNMVST